MGAIGTGTVRDGFLTMSLVLRELSMGIRKILYPIH